ncbi:MULTISPECIES: hypothetical protein [Paraburkholderia]|uniref:hypothetical protein n=1 Tax=Paraburkholderia TaxID=1822464 RepID=UPI00115FC60E|nr:hypothetical protein [Paraburkholderia fungorum]
MQNSASTAHQCSAKEAGINAARCGPRAIHRRPCARLTLRGKNTATKIENNSKIFGASGNVKEIDLKIE